MFKKLVGLLTVAVAGLFLGGVASAQGITGSAHDFSQTGAFNAGGEMCVVCHTPHNADLVVTDAPLWNHQVTAASFTVYAGPGTLDATVGQPTGVSKLCLSCHDGTVALDNFGGTTTGTIIIAGGANVGIDLSNDHPISLTYDTALSTTDGGLNDPATANSGLGGTISGDLLFGGSLECGSCHDVHDTAGNGSLLRVVNTGSALCLTCHSK